MVELFGNDWTEEGLITVRVRLVLVEYEYLRLMPFLVGHLLHHDFSTRRYRYSYGGNLLDGLAAVEPLRFTNLRLAKLHRCHVRDLALAKRHL